MLRPLDELDDLEQVRIRNGRSAQRTDGAEEPLADGLPALLRLHHHHRARSVST